MKSNSEKVPGFDEIIFGNRNKSYGAYRLRKGYNLTAGLSIIGGASFWIFLVMLGSALMPEPVIATTDPGVIVVVTPDNLIDPNKIVPPDIPKPLTPAPENQYIRPEVVDDTTDTGFLMMTNDFAATNVTDGIVTEQVDTMAFEKVIDEPEEEEILTFVAEPPEFPGGHQALLKFIGENTNYPQDAIENNIQGKVIVKFAVGSDGSVKKVEIMRGIHPVLDEEAMRVVSSLPRWKPGRQNGVPVSVWFNVPVSFEVKYY